MTQPIAGEIRMFAGNYAPSGWAFCDGQTVAIASYPSLYGAIGTLYGGDGVTDFQIPDLRGRVPVHRGRGFAVSQTGGSELADISADNVPGHDHTGVAPAGEAMATGTSVSVVADPRPITTFTSEGFASAAGGNNAHDNMQPFLSLHFIIALAGDADPVEIEGPFVGEVRVFAGRTAPPGWARCDGQALDIASHPELFSIVGTTYGGDGSTTFCVPDLRSRVALHAGQGAGMTMRRLGEAGGSSDVSLTDSQLPYHSHELVPAGRSGTLLVSAGDGQPGWNTVSTSDVTVGGAPHNNMQPYMALNYLIATRGNAAD